MPGGRGSPGRMDAAVPWGRWRALVGSSCHSQARGRTMLRDLDARPEEAGIMMRGGPIVDAASIEAPGSTKDRGRARPRGAPVQEGQGLAFRIAGRTSASMPAAASCMPRRRPPRTCPARLRRMPPVREGGASCRAGPGHMGVAERPEVASGPHLSPVRRTTARKPSAKKGLDCALPAERGIESRKASVRSKAEHPFLIAKRRSGHLKTRCRGVRKNSCMLCVSFAPADPAVRIPAGRSLASRPEAA